MHPRLVTLSGPVDFGTFTLGDAPFDIGRQPANALQVRQISVSRRHCVVQRRGGDFVLTDLESRHGTRVNGRPVAEHRLAHGDLVQVGDAQILFLAAEDPGSAPPPAGRLAESGWTAGSTRVLPTRDVSGTAPRELAGLLAGSAASPGGERAGKALLALAAELPSLGNSAALARRLAEAVLEWIPAERVAVLMAGATGEIAVLATASSAGGGAGETEPMTVSRTLVRRVMDDGQPRLLSDVAQIAEPPEGTSERSPHSSLAGAPSLIGVHLRSLACAPLLTAEGPLGALWAETVLESLEEEDLRRLSALAGLASGALATVRRAEWLEAENRRLRSLEEADHDMVGDSPAMTRVYDFIARAAPSDATVLIRGESGSGKELVARALHRSSRRSEGPFVAINCATLSETLLESELFGHEKGAFTGALSAKPGKLEVAHRGTVFLDEIGEIPLPLQAKLLRALELREFERVGGTRPIRVDVRLLAATHRDLEAAITERTFRQDLFYRLNVLSVTLPRLAERREDIALLARHFAARCATRQGRRVTGLTPAAREALLAYDWPGNVRELANAVERAVVLGEGEQIRLEDLPETVVEGRSSPAAPGTDGRTEARETTYHEALDAAKRRLILEAVEAAGGRYVEAAKRLDLHPNYLHRLIRNLGLKEEIEQRLGR